MSVGDDEINAALATGDDQPSFVHAKNGHPRSDHQNDGRPKTSNHPTELLDREDPHDLLAESAVLGSEIINPGQLTERPLYDTHFHNYRTRTVFSAMRQMRKDGVPIDIPHLVAKLQAGGQFDEIGGAAFLASLVHENEASPSRFPEYVERLRSLEQRRRGLHALKAGIKAVYSNQPTGELLTDLHGQFEVLLDDGGGAQLEYQVYSMAELAADRSEPLFDIEGVLVRDQPAIICAPAKCLKTSLASDAALSLATATKFLGVHEVQEQRRVLFMSGESGKSASFTCLNSIAEAKGFSVDAIDNFHWSPDTPVFGTVAHEAALRRCLRRFKPDWLVVDPAYRAIGMAKHENVFEMGGLLGGINDLCRSEGAALVLIHHTKKGVVNKFAPTSLDDLAYAGFREFFRQWILISRTTEYVAASGLHELRIDVGGSARHSLAEAVTVDEGPFGSPRWYVTVQGIGEDRDAKADAEERRKADAIAARVDRAMQRLIEAAARYPDGETISHLRDHAGISGQIAKSAISQALDEGHLVACDVTKNGRRERGFKLQETRSDAPGRARTDSS